MAIDVLSDVLRVVRLSGAVFFTAEFSSPWAVESPPPETLAVLVICAGASDATPTVKVRGG